jgi:hypothetical protein
MFELDVCSVSDLILLHRLAFFFAGIVCCKEDVAGVPGNRFAGIL